MDLPAFAQEHTAMIFARELARWPELATPYLHRLAGERTARAAVRLLGALPELVKKGNPNAASDAGAAALLLEAAAHAALLNVAINLGGIEDVGFTAEMRAESQRLGEEAVRLRERVLATVRAAF